MTKSSRTNFREGVYMKYASGSEQCPKWCCYNDTLRHNRGLHNSENGQALLLQRKQQLCATEADLGTGRDNLLTTF